MLGLEYLFEQGFDLAKAGVMLLELSDSSVLQGELDLEYEAGREHDGLMRAVDVVNDRYGKGTLRIASTGMAGDRREWTMRQQRRTPQYTTD